MDLLYMNLLIVLTVMNSAFIVLFYLFGKTTRMKSIELMVARSLGAYLLVFLALIMIILILLKEKHILLIAGYVINMILIISLIVYFLFNVIKSR